MQGILDLQESLDLRAASVEDVVVAADRRDHRRDARDRRNRILSGPGDHRRDIPAGVDPYWRNQNSRRAGRRGTIGWACEDPGAARICARRLKTGTPPRLDGRTIDWAGLDAQPGDDPPQPFSFLTAAITTPQIVCHVTATTPRSTASSSPTSIERPFIPAKSRAPDRAIARQSKTSVRFADRSRHQIFLEPEGLDDHTVYPNGISTSLPEDVQREMLRKIPGLEGAVMLRPGYAIEYDFVDPASFIPRSRPAGWAGSISRVRSTGTTGYEEGCRAGADRWSQRGARGSWWPPGDTRPCRGLYRRHDR